MLLAPNTEGVLTHAMKYYALTYNMARYKDIIFGHKIINLIFMAKYNLIIISHKKLPT